MSLPLAYKKALQAHIDQEAPKIARGNCKTWEDYLRRSAKIAGMEEAIQIIDRVSRGLSDTLDEE
ncbi:MAG: hypothetical protein IT514_15445 [Burkholderiales bacterium]|nr:hypothetical protein [Burkholderiales bacterium]